MRPKIGIGLPLIALRPKPLVSLCQALISTPAEMVLLIADGPYIQVNRTLLVKYAQEQQCSHLFFMDHDMVFPGDTIERLLAHDRDVIGGAYNMRGVWPRQTTVSLYDETGRKVPGDALPAEPFRCEAIGCGVMLIKMPVFDQIKKLWFDLVFDEDDKLIASEDTWFCNRVREAGLEVWCDPTIPVQHLGEFAY